jgi:hypothetical protein
MARLPVPFQIIGCAGAIRRADCGAFNGSALRTACLYPIFIGALV